ncbi:MAG: serine hydrolase domain-containing protein [Pseudomonadota bacterium]
MTATMLLAAVLLPSNAGFQQELDQTRLAQDIPGVSAVVSRGDQVLFAGASGFADLETRRPMTAETVLYCGSLSKVFTAVLALRLVEQKRLTLSDTVDGVLGQDLGAAGSISVQQLLTHTSGLDREGSFGYWFSGVFPSDGELQDYVGSEALRTAPGSESRYSNIGYATLGLLAAAASNQSYGEALASTVLRPLSMNASGTGKPAPELARGYSPVGRLLPSENRPFAGVGRRVGDRHLREYHHANAMTPAFGIQTTALDLSRLTRFLLGHRAAGLLSQSLLEKIRRRQAGGRGLGLRIAKANGVTVARHSGWFAAHRSHLLIDETNDLSVVVLTNSDNAAPAEIVDRLHALALAAVGLAGG